MARVSLQASQIMKILPSALSSGSRSPKICCNIWGIPTASSGLRNDWFDLAVTSTKKKHCSTMREFRELGPDPEAW
ncbi:unnamed protein product [Toxocara canis]|uniref:Uncharacterized protein n=1 Tax=Toxocara canis TaxID=6265 RepID=A0A183V1M0_TOXCA|nr:unnamed protein product [Toxocara canis]